ncbi:hypothetical protein CYMTET_19549 [Cymbomonas tetramitiformis]|uniref:CBS domain-containing protein n=1 Tax=Cymbomonas tetramitiformis TaxID=36881 RepID=A0AAE0G5S6_9CHLO|nr:hypothetical protein CYMTET_19549 [Cymbomonas tetramitiformis]|eukprot:gene11388-13460_t
MAGNSNESNCARNLLKGTTIKEVVQYCSALRSARTGKPFELLMLKQDCTIGEALDKLACHNVLSAPVIAYADAAGTTPTLPHERCDIPTPLGNVLPEESDTHAVPPHTQPVVVACIDVGTILGALLQMLTSSPHAHIFDMARRAITYEQLSEVLLTLNGISGEFFHRSLSTIPGSADGCCLYENDMSTDLLTVIDNAFLLHRQIFLAQKAISNHRIFFFKKPGEVADMLSQSDVLRFVMDKKDQLNQDLLKKTVNDLDVLSTCPVISVRSTVSALEAFRHMYNHAVSGIAVVDAATGRLVNSLSASDVRGLSPSVFSSLALPVGEFLKRAHDEKLLRDRLVEISLKSSQKAAYESEAENIATAEEDIVPQLRLITCTKDSSLDFIMRALLTYNVHRLYVVDEEQKPSGIVTVSNVLWALVGDVSDAPSAV